MTRKRRRLIWCIGAAILALCFTPTASLWAVASVYRTRVYGWRSASIAAQPKKPYSLNLDRMCLILPLCPSVNEVRFPQTEQLRSRLRGVVRSPWIVSLDLGFAGVCDDDLVELTGMRRLVWLDLTGNPKITDAGMAHLSGCEGLRRLGLHATSVTGTGLASLAACKNLEVLELMECPITDDGVALIPRFPRLHTLNLSDTMMTGKGLLHFVDWHSLRDFAIPSDIPRQPRLDFNREFRLEFERARAAGEEVPSQPGKGIFISQDDGPS